MLQVLPESDFQILVYWRYNSDIIILKLRIKYK